MPALTARISTSAHVKQPHLLRGIIAPPVIIHLRPLPGRYLPGCVRSILAFVCGIGDAMDTVATNTDFELCQLRSVHPFLTYHKRLAPLLAEFDGAPITPYPRNLLGFTPGQQGVCCVYCQSTKLITEGITVMPLDNPYICCLDCGQRFMLRVWRKQVKSNEKNKSQRDGLLF